MSIVRTASNASPEHPDAPLPGATRTLRFGTGPEWSSHQLALALAHTVGVVVFLAALDRASGGFPAPYWLVVLIPPTTMVFAGSGLTLGLMLTLLYGWFLLAPAGSFTWWSVPAAAGLLLSHVAVSLSATAPPAARFETRQLRRRARIALLALCAAPVVAMGAALLSGSGLGPHPAAYVLGLVGVAVGVALTRSNPPRPPD